MLMHTAQQAWDDRAEDYYDEESEEADKILCLINKATDKAAESPGYLGLSAYWTLQLLSKPCG